MAGERGFIYENTIFKELLSEGLTTNLYRPAQSETSKSDTAFKIGNTYYNLEIKLNLDVDFGQGTLRYDFNNKKWFSYAESKKMKELLDYYDISKFANEQWKKVPNKVGKNDVGGKRRKLTPEEIKEDYKNFPDKFLKLFGRNPIAEYYNSKNIYYIQIGGFFGFYYMGKDIAKLGVPEFNPRDQKIRIRRKGSGGGEYRFTTAFLVGKNITRSDYDIDKNLNFLINKNR